MNKWFWKMDYCFKKGIPPAESWAWDESERAYNEQCLNSLETNNE